MSEQFPGARSGAPDPEEAYRQAQEARARAGQAAMPEYDDAAASASTPTRAPRDVPAGGAQAGSQGVSQGGATSLGSQPGPASGWSSPAATGSADGVGSAAGLGTPSASGAPGYGSGAGWGQASGSWQDAAMSGGQSGGQYGQYGSGQYGATSGTGHGQTSPQYGGQFGGQYGNQYPGQYGQSAAGGGYSNQTGGAHAASYGTPQYPQSQPSATRPGAPAPWSTTTGPGTGSGGGPYAVGQQPPWAPRKRSRTWLWVAIALVAALVLGAVLVRALRGGSNAGGTASTSASATPTSSATDATPTASGTGSASATASVSGAVGKAADAITHLQQLGFTCSDESLSLYISRYCTHYGEVPMMAAYVGADADGKLGRLSLYYMGKDTDRSAAALSLQQWMVQAFLPSAGDAAETLAAVRKGVDATYATTRVGAVTASGTGSGSVILKQGGWSVDQDPTTLHLGNPTVSLANDLKPFAFTCGGRSTITCTRKERNGTVTTVGYWAYENDPAWLIVQVSGGSLAVAQKSYDAFMPSLFRLFLEGNQMKYFSQAHSHSTSGASEFHGGLLYENWSGSQSVTFHVGQSCWSDLDTWC